MYPIGRLRGKWIDERKVEVNLLPVNLILPIFNDTDAAASGKVVPFLKSLKPQRVWLILAPSVGVTAKDATKDIDARIARLEQDKNAAVGREDFAAASQFKQQIEDAKTERDNALRDGWRSVPTAQRDAAYDKVAAPYGELGQVGAAVQMTILSEDFANDNLLGMLNSLRPQWPAEIPHGEYALVWPQSVRNAPDVGMTAPASKPAATPAPKPAADKPDTKTPEGLSEYYRKYFMALKKDAATFGVSMDGPKDEVIAAVVEKKLAVAA